MATPKTAYIHLALIFCNVIWACDYPFYNLVLGKYISPLAMVSASLVIAAVWSLLPLLWEKPERIEPNDRLKIFGAAMLMGVARKMCMMFGLSHTSPIDGSIISTTTPLLVLLLSVFIGLERFTPKRTLGVLLGMAGTVAVIVTSNSGLHEKSDMIGNLLIFTSACVSAAYMVWFKRLLSKYRITTILMWIYCLSAIVMLPFGLNDILKTDVSNMSTKIMLAVLFVLIVPTYLPNLLLNYSLRIVAPTISSIYAYIQPVVAVALAVAMGLDKPHLDTIFFALIIFVGVGIVVGSYGKKSSVPTADKG
ncbi:MAG: DMT family transporter [Alistipes sp.]|nr:DMT family transporter [Alistipes sp.]